MTTANEFIGRGRRAHLIAGRKDADQYLLRLPAGLRERLAASAAESGRSVNTEIVDAVIKHLEGAGRLDKLEHRIAALERKGT